MANENKKDFNKMLMDSKDMPKIINITDEGSIKKYGGSKMLIAPPVFYDEIIRKIPFGKVITISAIRECLARKYGADFTDPMTAGIFTNIVAWANYQRKDEITPYWRCLKTNGELNYKYPGGLELQKELLEKEGHSIIVKGMKNIKYFVKDYTEKIYNI